jgi:hypothetical protein
MIEAQRYVPRARSREEARTNGHHAVRVYGHAVESYPETSIFNVTDVRLLVRVIEDLMRYDD